MVKKGDDHIWEWWEEWGTLILLIITILNYCLLRRLIKRNKKEKWLTFSSRCGIGGGAGEKEKMLAVMKVSGGADSD